MQKYKSIFNRIESVILMFSILCIISLIMFQGIFRTENNPVFSYYDNFKAGTDFEPEMEKEFGYIILRLESKNFSDVSILINGKNKYKFGNNTEIKLKANNNDIIAIDSSMYNEIIRIKVVGISKNVVFPKLSTEIITNGGINVVGSVTLN